MTSTLKGFNGGQYVRKIQTPQASMVGAQKPAKRSSQLTALQSKVLMYGTTDDSLGRGVPFNPLVSSIKKPVQSQNVIFGTNGSPISRLIYSEKKSPDTN
eukprot:CAMPEP_0170554344 /NCGR_PEP_ID=MMETSP0211-20121228/12188_1 /TAXON_ID=311385 /ORGANISM="Pseudokeronopsis sp., Strain OXSARD2" /LENGTH=99 /DNA_ID=CAMNT_0010863315 /DNA_START=329 /DNA_END=628 /DNA_ORIENTATION=-